MKTIQKISISIIAIFMLCIQIKAQESKIDFDGLQIGKSFKVLIENGWETHGKLIKVDSNSIEIKSEYKIFTIQKSPCDQQRLL